MKTKLVLLAGVLLAGVVGRAHAQAVISAPIAETLSNKKTGKQVGMTVEHGINKGLQSSVKVQSTGIRNAVQRVQELHKQWYDALELISNGVRTYRRVNEIFQMQQRMITQAGQDLGYLRTGGLSTAQLSRVNATYTNLLRENTALMGQLQLLLQTRQTKMTDAQRLKFIDGVADAMEQQVAVFDYFSTKARTVAYQAQQLRREEASLQALLGR